MGKINDTLIAEIKEMNNIKDVVSEYIKLESKGKHYVGLCPFHDEKTPSFIVYPESNSFYCFGCGVGGDVITFIGMIEKLDYVKSVEFLARRSGVELIQNKNDIQKYNDKIYAINHETAKFFHQYLLSPDGKWALDYLLSRGLTIDTIKEFMLGAAPDSYDKLIKHLKSKGFSIYDMMTANVIGKNEKGLYYDRFRKRIMFPILNVHGNVVAFSGRTLPGEPNTYGKYINTSDTPVFKKSNNLFGISHAKNNELNQIVLVEGTMDVISMYQAGFKNAVAILGTSFTSQQAELLSRYTKEVIIMLDADAAGQKAIKRTVRFLENIGVSVKIAVTSDAKDPDEYILKKGIEQFRMFLTNAISAIEYKLLSAMKDLNLENTYDKITYLTRAAEIISCCDDVLTRDIYIGKLCDEYKVTRAALTEKVEEFRNKNLFDSSMQS